MSAIAELVQRVERVENRLRIWRNIAYAACLFILITLIWSGIGHSTPESSDAVETLPLTEQTTVLQTRQLQIVNDDGNVVCLIGSSGNGGLITIENRLGNRTVQIGSAGSNGGSLFLSDRGGETNAEISGGSLFLSRESVTRATLSGSGTIRLNDEEGNTRFSAGTDLNGNGTLSMRYQNDRSLLSLGASQNEGHITLGSTSGKPVFKASSSIDGGAVAVHSSDGNVVGGLLANSAGSASLGISSSNGDGLFVAAGTEDGKGLMIVADPTGSSLVVDGGIMAIKDDNGEIALSAAADENGIGILKVLGPGFKQLVSAGADSSGNGIVVTHSEGGQVLWRSDQTSSGSGGSSLLGDLDNDGDVDFTDFIKFAQNFGRTLSSG